MNAAALGDVRRTAVATFYADNHGWLAWRVRRRVHGVDATIIADACATAWLTLVRRRDISLDGDGLAWLTTVAVHEAWRLGTTRHESAAGLMMAECDHEREACEPAGTADDPLDRVIAAEQHRDRVARFATLKPEERRELLLFAGGYKYNDIARLTGTSYTSVNRRLAQGRARLRGG
jgi:DNA-directed RNA polymerase specialized sigma24 family protein